MIVNIRKEIINSFFQFIDIYCEYVIFHHVDEIFLKDHDIDFGVECDSVRMLALVQKFCNEYNTKLINTYKIDIDIIRYDLLFKVDDERYELLELDCACDTKEADLLLLNSRKLIEDKVKVLVGNYSFYTTSPIMELQYYVKKKAFKKDDIEKYFFYFQKLNIGYDEKKIIEIYHTWEKYYNSKQFKYKKIKNKIILLLDRSKNNSSLSVSFLGPDGSGKSTIIDLLMRTDFFRNYYYFHLKPIPKNSDISIEVVDPHAKSTYSRIKSYIKLFYFVVQYNLGWIKNILKLKIKSSLIIFDRYYDDILVDHKRYRYGGGVMVAKFVRFLIPKPDLYFILTTDAKIIYERKKEVPFEELERQIESYRDLADEKKYFNIDVNREPEEIVQDIIDIVIGKMNERY